MNLRQFLLTVVAFIASLLAVPAGASPSSTDVVTVETCGDVVPPGRTAYLLSDLDCRGSATEGVVLGDRARLVLAGHAIFGDPAEESPAGRPLQGVRCEAGSVCTIDGPGAVLGFSASGVAGTRVRVREVYIAENAIAGISAFENVRLRDVSIADNGLMGVHAGGRVRASESDITSPSGSAIVAWHAPTLHPGCAPQP